MRRLIVTAALVTAGLVRAVAAHVDGESGSSGGKITETRPQIYDIYIGS